jgi:hypothetical protein
MDLALPVERQEIGMFRDRQMPGMASAAGPRGVGGAGPDA